jgi:hypothetical protein
MFNNTLLCKECKDQGLKSECRPYFLQNKPHKDIYFDEDGFHFHKSESSHWIMSCSNGHFFDYFHEPKRCNVLSCPWF